MNLFQVYTRYLKGMLRIGFYPSHYWLFWRVRRYTMVSPERLENVYRLAKKAIKDNVPGALVECGVWRGGCSAVMAKATTDLKDKRFIWLFDSFEGLPEPTNNDGTKAKNYANNRSGGKLKTINKCQAELAIVKKLFRKLHIDWNQVVVKQGWFQKTIPQSAKEIGAIAVLRLDGDWYESTKVCLEHLYDSVSENGSIIIDDYHHWEGCRRAVDEFLASRKVNATLIPIDEEAVYFIKE